MIGHYNYSNDSELLLVVNCFLCLLVVAFKLKYNDSVAVSEIVNSNEPV